MKDERNELRKQIKAATEIAEECIDALDDVITQIMHWNRPESVQTAFDSGVAWRKDRAGEGKGDAT